jgi:uncharacterized damage-inducible protein DinB
MIMDDAIKISDHAYDTLKSAIQHCPDELWKKGEDVYLTPCMLSFHILQCMEAYISENPLEYPFKKYGFDGETGPLEKMWDRNKTLEFLENMQEKTKSYIKEDSLTHSSSVPQLVETRLQLMIYAIRHMAQHTGEINAILRLNHLKAGDWLTKND